MARIRVSVLGPVRVEVDGTIVRLSPRALRVLMRLVAAGGHAVSVKQLRWELWHEIDRPHDARNGRNQVQKGVSELRRALDPGRSGVADDILRTERMHSGQESQSAYRLVLDARSLDAAEFDMLVGEALHNPAASAAAQLTRAVALWRGRPLTQAGDDEYAADLVRACQVTYLTALRELVRVHGELGRFDFALPVAERLVAEFPQDPDAAAALSSVRGRLRARHGEELLHRAFPELRTEVAIVRGDLFDQHDANLVIGFTDTFDIEMKHDQVISRASVQGQLVERLYGGDATALDRELRRGLRTVVPTGHETSRAKAHGKRTRYPLGTVVPVPLDRRRIFAAGYSRLGNDLVARARPEDLSATLDSVWRSAAQYGQMAPVAVPLLGSGLARINELSREQLVCLIVESFLRGCRDNGHVAPQLRLVLRPIDLERVDMTQVANDIAALDLDLDLDRGLDQQSATAPMPVGTLSRRS